MSLVATLICNPNNPALDSTVVDGARAILPEAGTAHWLFDEVAVDIPFAGSEDAATVVKRLSEARGDLPIDIVVQPQIDRRKKLFLADGCYECHGREGQGAAQTGAARIGPPMLSFDGFQNYVRSPKNQMPPYSAKALPDQDLADIYAFLKSIPMPPKVKDIPLLNR